MLLERNGKFTMWKSKSSRLSYSLDRDSFEDCLRENDVIPNKSERDRLKKCLQDRPYSKLILKCYQPTGYHLLSS